MRSVDVTVGDDGSVTWEMEDPLPPLVPQPSRLSGAALFVIAVERALPRVDIDAAVPIYVVEPQEFDRGCATVAARARAR